MRFGLYYGVVCVVMSSEGHDMCVDMVAARNVQDVLSAMLRIPSKKHAVSGCLALRARKSPSQPWSKLLLRGLYRVRLNGLLRLSIKSLNNGSSGIVGRHLYEIFETEL